MAENIETTKLASNINDFTQDFHMNVANKIQGNFVVSALSTYLALSMVAYGAGGNTSKQMRQLLRLKDNNDDEARREFQTLIDAVNNVSNVTLKIANKLCICHDLNVKEKFKDITADIFRSDHDITYNTSDPAKLIKNINEWCHKKTGGKIEDLLKVEDITPLTKMIILNAVYFKGEWKYLFDEELTRSEPFYVHETITVNASTMIIKEKFFYKENLALNVDYISIPYKNEDISMHIIVPKEGNSLKSVEDNLKNLDDGQFFLTEMLLKLPKFKVEFNQDLKEHLEKMGMDEMFGDLANFENIADIFLKVEKVKQKAFVEINEKGSEASAVSGIQVGSRSMPRYLEINVNRPFLYKIVYKNVVLFSGRIVNPLEQDGSKILNKNDNNNFRTTEL